MTMKKLVDEALRCEFEPAFAVLSLFSPPRRALQVKNRYLKRDAFD